MARDVTSAVAFLSLILTLYGTSKSRRNRQKPKGLKS